MATSDFISLYMHHIGKDEVPRQYHYWCAITLVAACVADRVKYPLIPVRPTAPNLYVCLLGPPGVGKGLAISTMLNILRGNPAVPYYQGRATIQHIIDELAGPKGGSGKKSKTHVVQNPKLLIVHPELMADMGRGERAEDFIAVMTKVYEGDTDGLRDGSRTHGGRFVANPCFNWVLGSTMKWLMSTLPRDAFEGGFLSRLIIVPGEYDLDPAQACPRGPILPNDYEECVEELRERALWLAEVEGEFVFSRQARAFYDDWYVNHYSRAPMNDDGKLSIWRRAPETSIKLAMIHALAEGRDDLVIRRKHLEQGIDALRRVRRSLGMIRDNVGKPREAEPIERVAGMIRAAGDKGVARQALLRKSKMLSRDLARVIQTLMDSGDVAVWRAPAGRRGPKGLVYGWLDRRL